MTLTLHSAWRATAPYRVRIGLELKGLAFDYVPVNLAGGQQREAAFRLLNPLALVPALEADGRVFTQSLAILEWLEETHPDPPLLPVGAGERAVVRAMAAIVACDIHPLNNLRVLRALNDLGHPMGGADQVAWGARWIADGFAALEPMVAAHGRGF
ncbi:MAG: glutathione S-transferase N-terminal domain-containing protein, partial [Caulobacteraceae bacterium]